MYISEIISKKKTFHTRTSDLSVPISIKVKNKYRFRAAYIICTLRNNVAYYWMYWMPRNLLGIQYFTYCLFCQVNFASLSVLPHNI